jgi:hypothetical protein
LLKSHGRKGNWRDTVVLWFGPGFFGGVTFGDWLTLLKENHFEVDPRYWLRAWIITLGSLSNSLIRRREEAIFGQRIAATEIAPPLFILGIWRSGTTHLHNLFGVDDRFAFPNVYQVCFPHTFLLTEAPGAKRMRFFLPRTRMQDNVRLSFEVPSEDELALCVTTFYSVMMSAAFPHRAAHYDRYVTFRGVSDAEVRKWQETLLWFAKKVSLKSLKPLVLKSPLHTGRIRLLLEIFPDARFVHIHRDPYAVFQSARHTLLQVRRFTGLQRSRLDVDDQTIRYYQDATDAYFDEKGLIPKDRFHELRFADLERDPIGQTRMAYEALGLPDFGHVEPAMTKYLASLSGYEKNTYPALDPERRARIAREWRKSFEGWGYPL